MDICLLWDAANGCADFAMDGAQLALGNDLETAVLISLFTDEVADPADLSPLSEQPDPRGWWADTYEADQIGSKLWQAFSRVRNQDTLNWASDTASRALQWLIDDGVARSIEVSPSFYGKGGLALSIVITEPSGKASPFRFVWDQLAVP
jgi:phage gp46-like protein